MGNKTKPLMSAAIAALAGLALAGCGESAPSDANIREAMARQMEQMMGKQAAESQKDDLAKVKVVKCAKAELGGFNCEFDGPMGRATGRFKKESEGWVFAGPGV